MQQVPTSARCQASHPAKGSRGVLATERRRILVVDDDPSVLGLLQALLDTLGNVDVETCSDPEAAVRRVREGGYDLVISDERMPKKSGIEVLSEVRACSPRTPTILLTAYDDGR